MSETAMLEPEVIDLAALVTPDATRLELRGKILALEAALLAEQERTGTAPPEIPIRHEFATGLYAREMTMPVGALVIGKIHKHDHLIIVSKGSVSVMTEDGLQTFTAPAMQWYRAGVKRVLFAHEETVWTNLHPTTLTNLEAIEADTVAETYEQLAGATAQEALAWHS